MEAHAGQSPHSTRCCCGSCNLCYSRRCDAPELAPRVGKHARDGQGHGARVAVDGLADRKRVEQHLQTIMMIMT